jgi:hypothetical protein
LGTFTPANFLRDKSYVSLSALQESFSSSVTSSATSLRETRLKTSSFTKDLVLPVNWKNLDESLYFGSAFVKTRNILSRLIESYPIGLSGASTSALYLEDIESSVNYISNLTDYEWWVMRQLCGETLTSSTMTYTASATAVSRALSATITSDSPTFFVPVINRDGLNFVAPPQGVGANVNLDTYYTGILQTEPTENVSNSTTASPFEQILNVAAAFDAGIAVFSRPDWSGTASDVLVFSTLDGLQSSRIVPEQFSGNINRTMQFRSSVPEVYFEGDDTGVLDRFLESLADVLDETKLYIESLKWLFKNHWANWEKLPKGYVQQLVARQYGVEVFSSQNREVKDNLAVRGSYMSEKEVSFTFWNRMLSSLSYLLKTKGAIEAVRATARAYGFPSSLMEVYELDDYASSVSGYYSSVRNISAGAFRRSQRTNGKRAFQSVTASLTSSSLTAATTTAFTVHLRAKFIEDISLASQTASSGVLFSLTPSASVTYSFVHDADPSTSGYPYVSFSFNFGTASLTTGYSFVRAAQAQSYDGYWSLMFGRSGSALYASNSYVLDGVNFVEPTVATASTTAASYSSTTFSPTTVVLGSTSSTDAPLANIHSFYFQKTPWSYEQAFDLALDPGFLSTPLGFSGNVLAWRLNENVTLQDAGKNYVLDAGVSGLTGSPTLFGFAGKPYEYLPDAATFYDDDVPGFKVRRLTAETADFRQSSTNNGRRDLRVAISLASPIDAHVHTMFGSNFGVLFADPSSYYSTTGRLGSASYQYDMAEDKLDEIYSVRGASRSDVRLTDFLKFLNRVSGHVSSFFRFVDQVIPASQDILEKGILIENPFSRRTIVAKSAVSHPEDPVSSPTIDGALHPTLEATNVDGLLLDGERTVEFDFGGVTSKTIDAGSTVSFVPITLSGLGTTGSLNGAFTFGSTVFESAVDCGSLDGARTGGGYAVSALEVSVSADSRTNTESDGERKFFIHFPRTTFSPVTKTVYSQDDTFQENAPKIQYIPPKDSAGRYFLNVVVDEAKILASTSATASDSDKRITGTVFFVGPDGRKIAAPYLAFRVDLRECVNSDGLNLFRFTVDGEDISLTEHIKEFKVFSKDGAKFAIDIKGSPSEGNDPAQECKVYFDNLVDATQVPGKAIDVIVSDSMQTFSRKTGLSVTRTT